MPYPAGSQTWDGKTIFIQYSRWDGCKNLWDIQGFDTVEEAKAEAAWMVATGFRETVYVMEIPLEGRVKILHTEKMEKT